MNKLLAKIKYKYLYCIYKMLCDDVEIMESRLKRQEKRLSKYGVVLDKWLFKEID